MYLNVVVGLTCGCGLLLGVMLCCVCRSLLQDAERPRMEKVGEVTKEESRPPHHDNLYKLVSGIQNYTQYC